jgi:predicted Co/Zn/Cd cation transporter (cation efflux family)
VVHEPLYNVSAALEGIDLGSNAETAPQEKKRGVDPLTLVFWGMLLAGYGLYASYSAYINPLETLKTLAVGPYAVVAVFGVIVAAKGYRDYRAEKKEKEK